MKCYKEDIKVNDRISYHQMVLLCAHSHQIYKEYNQEMHPFFQQMPPQRRIGRQKIANGPFQQSPKKEGLLGKILGKSKQNSVPPNLFALPSQVKSRDS